MMAGPEPLMGQEERYVSALERVRGYRVMPEQLALLDETGQTLLVFVPTGMAPTR